MKMDVTESDFVDAFDQANRSENFSRQGRQALYDAFIQYEEDMGEEIDFDVIAVCCEYTEYESIDEYNEAYGTEHEDWEDLAYDGPIVIPFSHDDYFAEGHSVMNPLVTFRAIVQDH